MTALEIQSLSKTFGSKKVVRDLSLSVEEGQIYGLIGPNGSGKTTTLSCTLGLMRATSGTARVLGEPPHRLHHLGGRLAVVFDTAIAINSLRVRQNLAWLQHVLGHRRGRGVEEVLDLVDLRMMEHAKTSALSLGQRKRLAIAGALLGEPALLILDEPLSGLDTLSVRRMLRLFRKLRDEGVTLVLSSHRLIEMQTVVTHAGFLLDGRIALGGSLEDVIGRSRDRYLLRVARAGPEREVVAALDEIELLPPRGAEEGDPTVLRVHAPDGRIAQVNRALIESGCELLTTESIETNLQAIFEDLVDRRMAEEVRS